MPAQKTTIPLNKTTMDIIVGLHVAFGDYEKSIKWLFKKNKDFSNLTPAEVINNGQASIVRKYINLSLHENRSL